MSEAHDQIARVRIIPVVCIDQVEHAMPLADALAAGGIPIAEITLRSECAIPAISELASRNDFLVGAGTVLDESQCQAAIEAGARFIVSPGLDQMVIEMCLDAEIACFPGVATATEVLQARNFGLQTVKFFPADSLGGTRTLQAFGGPFPDVKFIPSGGIDPGNVTEYLALPSVAAVGGSWMTRPDLYRDGDFSSVTQLAADAAQLVVT